MASQSDVEVALVELAAATLYPGGIASAPSIGAESRIYRGWPNAALLETDLAAGIVHVSVFPTPNSTTDTTRYLPCWLPEPTTPTLTVSSAGNSLTFFGTADLGQLAGILVDGHSFVHRTILGDTPESVAAVLGEAIAMGRPASVSNSTITVANASSLVARTAADASSTMELRRQRQGFRITAWCPSPELRDVACGLLDVGFAGTPFLVLSDGSSARLRLSASTSFDDRQDALLYRRDMVYSVEFPTTQVAIQPAMLFGIQGLGATTILV